ncbi:tRNA pseudouridine synthase A [Acidianus sulfidivorans JP7]|uniref:tRNA pseudouridine synthase A n=1 Tax=Acidianus sulfidivorans JP7 TaxID=619593 RepID=A0A2U9IM94_9CREN|nr:tRNA pseudouridine synthase A [Acidianus sulfidivorans]AWR97189.1 tRNA pseudouridine synthase A [Acidianus sulfidivorans JP7]
MNFYPFIYKIDEYCNYKNKWYIKKESETSENIGFFPDKREINFLIKNSIINIDKPAGPTSHEIAFWVKQMFKVNKVGHGGTLEPL